MIISIASKRAVADSRLKSWIRAFLLVAFIVSGRLISQTKVGTTVGQFMLIEPSARIAAMGNAGTSLSGEAFTVYYNPGSLSLLPQSEVQFTHNTWFTGISLNHAVAAIRISEAGSVVFSITQLSSGDIDVRTVEHPDGTGERYTVGDLALGLGYGVQVTDRFSFGIHFHYVQERIWHSSINLLALNIGTVYQLSTDGLRIGASLSNFGTKAHYEGTDLRVRYDLDPNRYGDNSNIPGEILTDDYNLPIIFRVGLGYPLAFGSDFKATIALDALHPSDNSESLNIGAEFVFKELFALRAGYQNLFLKDSELGLTLGGGIMWDGLGYEVRCDYAWAAHGRLGDTQRITVGLAF